MLPLLVIICLPLSVQAGVFSTLVSLLDEPATAEAFSTNTKTPYDAMVLSAANHSNPQAAIGGGDVVVDEWGALVSTGTVGPDDVADGYTSNEISVHTVRQNETLSEIAEMYNVSINTVYWSNDISDPSLINPGDTLVILPITGVRHVVKKGETLSTIAKKYDGDIEEIISYNQLASADAMSVGDTIVIPNGTVQSAPARTYATPVSTSGAIASVGSYFSHPLPGSVRTQGLHGNNGVDFGASIGTPIRAAAAGEVIVSRAAGWNGGYGAYVVIRHPNGTQTLYAHNSSNAVGVGAYVAQGEVIGYVGNSGRSTGAHLHFEVRGARNPF